MEIKRTGFDREIIERNLGLNDASLERFFEWLSAEDYPIFRKIALATYENFCFAAGLGLSAERQRRYLELFKTSSLINMQLSLSAGKAVQIEFEGKHYEITPDDHDHSMDESKWRKGYFAALALRDREMLRSFCSLDLNAIDAQSELVGGRYSYLYARFLQRLFFRAEPHEDNLIAAMSEIKEDKMPAPTFDFALYVDGPQMDLFMPIILKKQFDFSRLLLEALENHKKYYKKRANHPESLISLPLTAICVLAIDHGLTIEHTSDYLAKDLF